MNDRYREALRLIGALEEKLDEQRATLQRLKFALLRRLAAPPCSVHEREERMRKIARELGVSL